MLPPTASDRERYEARRNALLKFKADMDVARMEGREEGRVEGRLIGLEEGREVGRLEGEKIGTIQLCERWLQRSLTADEEMAKMSLEELTRLADALQAQLL